MSQPLPVIERTEQLAFLRTFGRVSAAVAASLATGHALTLHYWPSTIALGSGALAFLLLAPFARRTSSAAAGHYIAVVVTSLVTYVSFLRGDMPLGALIYLCVLPLVVQYLSGSRAAAAWAFFGVVITAFFLWRVESGNAVAAPPFDTPVALAQKDLLEAAGVIGMLTMMTALSVALERRRNRVERARLGRLAARLRRLASSVAHEVNNPLAWMTSSTTFLQRSLAQPRTPELDRELDDCATDLVDGTRRLTQFSEDLRALTHENVETASGDPHRVIRLVKSLVGVAATAPAEGLPRIKAAEGPLTELLVELLLSTTETGGTPRLAVALEGAQVAFTVAPVAQVDQRVVDDLLGPGHAVLRQTSHDLIVAVASAAA